MLKENPITEEVTLRQTLTLEVDGQKPVNAVEFSTTIQSNAIARPVSTRILDDGTLYEENISQVRQAQYTFQQKVWEVEDRIRQQLEAGETS